MDALIQARFTQPGVWLTLAGAHLNVGTRAVDRTTAALVKAQLLDPAAPAPLLGLAQVSLNEPTSGARLHSLAARFDTLQAQDLRAHH